MQSKFDSDRAGEYAVQSRIALVGYDACHELSACLLAASLGRGGAGRVLVAGVGGTAREIIVPGQLEPGWRFTAVDPSAPMLELARRSLSDSAMEDRADPRLGAVDDLPEDPRFDAAMLIGVLHHLPGREAKLAILNALVSRLAPGAPMILAGNRHAYASRPLFLAAWRERWRMNGSADAEIEAKIGKILQGTDPPDTDVDVEDLLVQSGFERPTLFFSSLFWGGWITQRVR
jgi:tRNA (cmo5U34)-methyltransferase